MCKSEYERVKKYFSKFDNVELENDMANLKLSEFMDKYKVDEWEISILMKQYQEK